jgi:hypothetical protein
MNRASVPRIDTATLAAQEAGQLEALAALG